MDYFDILLAKKLSSGSGGDIDVESLTATENGTYNAGTGKAYNPVIVEVPEPTLITKNITANGTYNASDDSADGYSSVTVDVEGYQIKNIPNVPADIASFSDGTDLPMPSLVIGIEPVQSGSGDPSPSNPRPISGWTGANVNVSFINLWNEIWELGNISATTGEDTDSTATYRSKGYIPIKNGESLYMYIGGTYTIGMRYYDKDKRLISTRAITESKVLAYGTLDLPSNCYYIRFVNTSTNLYSNDISINYPSTNTTYHAYNGTTTPISFGQTVYGGELDVTTGVLTVTHANIASYNGETINEPWISSMDVYSAGATPTTGAQVVYPLTTPITIQLTPTQITTLLGTNNLWADSGEVKDCIYIRDLNAFLNQLDARVTALENA